MKANPDVSFLVDNHDLTLGASGVMMQGRVKVYSIAKTVASILSVGPKMAKFSKKYLGMFTFYAKGRGCRTRGSSTSTGSSGSSRPRSCTG
jgi:hypothetical protein